MFGLFIRAVDAGEVLQLTRARLAIQALHVALFCDIQRRVHIDLDEIAVLHQVAHHLPLGPEGRDEGGQHDQPGIGHQPRHLAHAADVFHPVGIGKAQIAVQPVTHIVAIQKEGVLAQGMQLLFHDIGDGRFARTRQAGEPDDAGLLVLLRGMGVAVHIDGLPMHVLAAAQGEMDHPRRDRRIGHAVDQDETAQIRVGGIGFERDRAVGRDVHHPDRVQPQCFRGQMLQRVDVHLVFRLGHGGGDGLGAQLQQIGAARQHLGIRHPDQRRLELVGDLAGLVGLRDHVAARTVDLVLEGQGDGLTRDGQIQIAVMGDDGFDPRGLARGQHPDRIARTHAAGADLAGKAAEIQIGTVHPLHRHAEGIILHGGIAQRRFFQMAQQRRPLIPRHMRAFLDDIVALQPGNRDRQKAVHADLLGEMAVIADDLIEPLGRVIDQIHLVDRQHHVADAQQVHQIGMPPRLGQHALARVDQDHRQIGGRGAGDHVAGVLFMARRVGDDEFPLVGGEKAIGHVDGDALLAFRCQTVHQQRKVDLSALGADALAVVFQAGQLILEDHLAVIEQPPDQRRFAVIDRSAGDEAQHGLVLVLFQIGVDILGDQRIGDVNGVVAFGDVGVGGHQKYPSCFFFSIEAD